MARERIAPSQSSPARALLPASAGTLWSVLSTWLRSVEQTSLGGLALHRLWPAYFFCLVLFAKGGRVREVLTALPERVAERGGWEVTSWLLHQTLSLAFLSLVVVLFIVRKPPLGERSSLLGALVAIAGTFALALSNTSSPAHQTWPVLALASALILVGTLFATISLATLGRCFGLFPEARGLVTRGPYSWIRHPVYLGEMISGFGLILPHLSAYNAAVLGLFVGLQYWRAINEEHALEAAFPEYAAYRARSWRLVPWVH